MKPKAYPILEMAVENGIRYGYRRAHKHVESPDPDAICAAIHMAVMNELSEWFDFEDNT